MKTFRQVARAVEDRARRDPEKRDQSFAIVVADWHGVTREEQYAPPDIGILFLDELRRRVQECVRNKRDTATDVEAAPLKSQAVILMTHRGQIYGAIAVAGRGSQNAVLAEYGRDVFFNRKPRLAHGGHHGKA